MDDKLKDLLKNVVQGAVAKNLNQAVSGKQMSGLVKSIGDAIGQEQTAQVSAIRKTDVGLVFVTSPETLLYKTAAELRSDDVIIPDAIPDSAVIKRDAAGGLVFVWQFIEVIDADDPSGR